jgi:flagellar hook-basal body complex protein FliE
MNRDEYVEKLKSHIDRWNSEAAKLEERAKQAQASAKAGYAAQLEKFREQRNHAIDEMKRVQAASMDAWSQLARGADTALKSMQDAFEKARAGFDSKNKDKP